MSVLVLGFALVAVACGDDDAGSNTTSDTATGASTVAADPPDSDDDADREGFEPSASDDPQPTPDDQADQAHQAEASEPGQVDTASVTEEVTVVDAFGEVTLTPTATGVYALDDVAGLVLLALGVEPLVVEQYFRDQVAGMVLEAAGATITPTGSVEAVAAADPELIVSVSHPGILATREQYEGITTVVTPEVGDDWSDLLRVFGAVTGTDDRAEVIIELIQARIDGLRTELEAAGFGGAVATVIQPFGSAFFAYGPGTLPGNLLEELGFTRTEVQSNTTDDNFGFIPVSGELLAQEADVDVVFAVGAGEGGGIDSILDHPTVEIGDTPSSVVLEAWYQSHPLTAWMILDDVESTIFGAGTATTTADLVELWDELLAEIDAASAER
ncbi:MAG: ABC transporter substrate-binding protein [Actinomycetota bacterium]